MAAAVNFHLDKRHYDSVLRRKSAFEVEVAKAVGRLSKQKSHGGQTLINLSGKLDYVLVSETEISELKLILGRKNDEDGKKHYRTFIHEGSLEEADAYLNKQTKMNSKFVVQPESVIEDRKGGYLSVTHQQLNAFCYHNIKERAAYWGISRVYAILRNYEVISCGICHFFCSLPTKRLVIDLVVLIGWLSINHFSETCWKVDPACFRGFSM